MRGLKLTGIILGALIALIAVALLAVWLFVNPNDFKGRIVTAVKASTGRDLALPGDIRLSVFPSIALELGPASLGNPPGFAMQPFASVKRIDLHVKLLPLLHKQLSVGRIEIDGLDLRLEKNGAGKGNWEDFGAAKEAPATPAASSGTLGDIAGVLVKDSRVSYQDMVAEQLNLEVGHFAPGTSTPVKAKLNLRLGPQAAPIGLSAAFEVLPDLANKRYQILKLDLAAARSAAPNAPAVSYKFAAPRLALDLAAGTLSAPDFTAQLADAHFSGSAQGTKIATAPQLSGTFKLDPVAPRDLLTHLGLSVPKTRDPRALSKLAASGAFRYGGNAVEARDLEVRLEDSTLRGMVAVSDLDTKAMAFDLNVDRIDLDRYRSPEPPAPEVEKKSPEKAAELPSDALKALRLNGKLAVGSATVAGVKLTELTVSIVAKDGVTHIAPAKAKLYGGTYSGDIVLDGRGTVPAMKLDQSMTNIDAGQLAKDFAKSNRISGRGNVTMNVTARGNRSDTLLSSLAGQAAASLDNGAIEGVDLWFEINRAVSVIQKQALPSGQSSGRTRFDTFKASADIANGVASTKDLNIASQNLRITGQGTANLVSEAINYQVKAIVLKDVAAKSVLAEIPVTITGTLAKPKVSPDLEGLAKARVQQELDKHKDELKKKLQDQLQNLLK